MELQLTEGTKKKSTEYELKHKSMFSHFNTPLSRNTYRLQKGNEPSLITPGLIYEAHLDKITSTHTTKGMFLFPKKKKKKKTDKILLTSYYRSYKLFHTQKNILKQEYLLLMSEHFIYFKFLCNKMLFKQFHFSGSCLNKSCYPQDIL